MNAAWLLECCVDWNGAEMLDDEEPRAIPNVGQLRDVASMLADKDAEIARLTAKLRTAEEALREIHRFAVAVNADGTGMTSVAHIALAALQSKESDNG